MELKQRTLFVLDPEADPAAQARELRRLGPLVAVELPGGVAAWTATDLGTAQRVMGHEDLTKDAAHWPDLAEGRIPDDWELIALVRGAAMLHQGGAEHRRLRSLASAAFTRAPIEALRPRIEAIAEELLDAAEASGARTLDLREQFAYPLPVRVICEVLGVPDSAVAELRDRFERLVTPGAAGDIRTAVADIHASLGALVAAKRAAPGEDLTTALIQARDEEDRLTEQELVETLFLVLIAGHETTINGITNTVHALLEDRQALARLLESEDPGRWAAAADEGLRFSSPVPHALMRYALRDTEIAGVRVARGEPVIASLFAAGRDPGRHEDPERFDHTRSTVRDHAAFGFGAHYCLGARLARLETEVALRTLFGRWPELAAAPGAQRLSSIALQGFRTLPVHLAGRGADGAVPAG
ncbi:cytochrome P450 [Streptomyces sp. NPDC047968]|uniref:cytochrome P450 family protein n=1 Tax=unclassified Streptomyces TaxID=2593676 RepID=UPI00342A49D7